MLPLALPRDLPRVPLLLKAAREGVAVDDVITLSQSEDSCSSASISARNCFKLVKMSDLMSISLLSHIFN